MQRLALLFIEANLHVLWNAKEISILAEDSLDWRKSNLNFFGDYSKAKNLV